MRQGHIERVDNVVTLYILESMNTTIQFRIDKKTKDQAKKTFEAVGLDMSSGIKVYLKQVARTRAIPFEIRTANGFTHAQERQMIKETEWALQHGKRYTTIEEAHRDILKK